MVLKERQQNTDAGPEPNPRYGMNGADPHPEISLPPDLVSDVLSRLPVKTLGRLRCVCKQWYSLTYDPYFIRTQHQRARSRPVFLNRFLHGKMITHYEFGGDGKIERNSFAVKTGFDEESTTYYLWNSVNGLTCVSRGRIARSICLLNPTTRELLQLPYPCGRDELGLEYFGLGFDDSAGEYKVVRVLSRCRTNFFDCEILTVGTQKWSYVGKVPLWITALVPVFLHGALHWGAKHEGTGDGGGANLMNIIPFDIKNETFGSVILVPSDLPLVKLGELGGHLCAIMEHHWRNSFDIWTLKDYGSCQWTKEFSITLDFPEDFRMLPFFVDATYQKILFQTRYMQLSDIYSYEVQSKTSSKVYDRIEGPFFLAAHVEGLISPRKIIEIV